MRKRNHRRQLLLAFLSWTDPVTVYGEGRDIRKLERLQLLRARTRVRLAERILEQGRVGVAHTLDRVALLLIALAHYLVRREGMAVLGRPIEVPPVRLAAVLPAEPPLLPELPRVLLGHDEHGRGEVVDLEPWPTPAEIEDYERDQRRPQVRVRAEEKDGWVFTPDEIPLPELVPGAAQVTPRKSRQPPDDRFPTPEQDRAELVAHARRMLTEGYSKRHIARYLDVPESTLRRWLKS